jgi:hypothetical protein
MPKISQRNIPSFSLHAASDGGFIVMTNRYGENPGVHGGFSFAGPLTDCLDYIKDVVVDILNEEDTDNKFKISLKNSK